MGVESNLGVTPTPEELREIFIYNQENGELRWASDRNQRIKSGMLAGTIDRNGYVKIKIRGLFRFGHRIAWAIHSGAWPTKQIDHINGIRSDNRIANLREATAQENQANRHKGTSVTGYRGVMRSKGGKFVARRKTGDKLRQLGTFATAELAAKAYDAALIAEHGAFANPNFPSAPGARGPGATS